MHDSRMIWAKMVTKHAADNELKQADEKKKSCSATCRTRMKAVSKDEMQIKKLCSL